MKLLIAHNRYHAPGGEDVVFSRELALLRSAGHDVVEYVRQNTEIPDDGTLNNVRTGIRTLWAWDTRKDLQSILRRERPQLVHFHNTFPLISPAAYYACKDEGVPVVQSLHNPRVLCPAATLYRKGRTCDDCLGRSFAWPGVLHACYHDSFSQTAIVAGMLALHRHLGTWQQQVDAYIVFTKFFRQKFIAAGIPGEKIFVKPHFLSSDPGMKQQRGNYALFLGRLVPEKGVLTLLKAWRTLKHIPLWIAGNGSLENGVHQFQRGHPWVRTFPHLPQQECFDLIKGARFLVWPSEGHGETFGLVAIEAFACGTPVIASNSGAMQEIVEDGKTGLHFEAGNAQDLAEKVEWAWRRPRDVDEMGSLARAEYEAKYTAERNYHLLMEIYNQQEVRQHGKVMKNGQVNHLRSRLDKAREMWHFLATQDAFRRAPLLTLWRSATWCGRCLLRMETVLELQRWNVRMFFPAQRRGFGKFIFAFRENYEPELAYLEKILSPGKVFIDGGANFGVYALVASKLVGETGRVMAFEPTAQSFAILRKNIDLNHSSNVSTFQIALTETRSKAWLYHGWDPVGNSLGKDPQFGNEGEEVRTETLDQVLAESGIDRVDAIKLDVEGAEELVLRGAIRCLTTQNPIVIFEFNPGCAARLGLSPWGAKNLLESLDYEFVLLGDCAKSYDPRSRPTYFNIVAIPKRSAGELTRSFPLFRQQPEVPGIEELDDVARAAPDHAHDGKRV